MSNTNNSSDFDSNPSWFLIQWLRRLYEQEMMERVDNQINEILRQLRGNEQENIEPEHQLHGNNTTLIQVTSGSNAENDQKEPIHIEDSYSIITVSDIIVGRDEMLNAGVIENVDNANGNNLNENENNENNTMSEDGDSENGNHTPGIGANSDFQYYDYDRDVIFNRANDEVIVDASNINEYIGFDESDEDETVIFDFNEYAEQQQQPLVNYSDTESEDSYFSKQMNQISNQQINRMSNM